MILLDTNALIAIAQGSRLRDAARSAVAEAYDARELAVSATTAWEIGLLATRTGRTSAIFAGDGRRWFRQAVARFDLNVVPLDAAMGLEAAYLPDGCPRDPADRWVIAVARILDATLVTSDAAILAYAAKGYVTAIRW